ncbi:MAG: hypothetical protein AB7U82_27675 [Blastocatellales bacterium]
MEQQPQPGDIVIYHDPKGVGHSALVTCVWTGAPEPLLNVVYVSGDDARQDSYGRQLERSTSTMHKSQSNVHGNYWRWPHEQPNAYTPPAAV